MAEKERAGQERTEGKYWEPDGALENSTNPKTRMQQMKKILEHSEKGGLFKKNSALFNKVIKCIQAICDIVDKKLVVKKDKRFEQLKELDEKYRDLIEACEQYLDRTSRTIKGQNRQRMVAYIQNLAEKDRQALGKVSGDVLFDNNDKLHTTSGSTMTISMLMATMRTRVIEMGEGEHGTVGGKANSLTVLDGKKDGIDGFFSERKIIHRNGAVEGKDKTSYDNAFGKNLVNLSSDTFDSNARNVATSRIAELLGVGRLVAKSEMAELRKPGEKTGKMGSVMEKAKGEKAINVMIRVVGDALRKKGKDRWKSNNPDFQKEIESTMKDFVTGDFIRDMSDLQVLDYLCGQIDRHHENYFVSLTKDGKFSTVQGIDNDLSFGDAQEQKNRNDLGLHGRRVVSEDGELFIPHMSKSFAEAIETVDESMIRLLLADLIEAPEVDAFCRRLATLKKAIAKELQKKPEESKLLEHDQWDNTLDDYCNAERVMNDKEESVVNAKGSSNYVGNIIKGMAYEMEKNKYVFARYKSGEK